MITMKRFVFLFSFVFIAGIVFAQNSVRTTAFNYLRQGKLDKAQENIDKAIEHEKTMNDPKTWFYRGSIYYEIAITDNDEFKNLSDNAFEESYLAFKRAIELDEKNQFYVKIIQNMNAIGSGFYNMAVADYNEDDYAGAADNFMMAYEVKKTIEIVDTAALYNAAIAAVKATDTTGALDYYMQLREMDYKNPGVYESLATIKGGQGDIDAAAAYLTEGREKYPDDYGLLIAEINLHMKQGNVDEAINSMNAAIEHDPTNYTIYNALGNMFDNMIDDEALTAEERNTAFENAKESYQKAIEHKQDFFDAYYNLGALFVNKAAEYQNEANGLPLDKQEEYDALVAKANGLLKEALPSLEKAHELQPDDRNTIISLKEIYTRLGELDKAKEMSLKLQ